MNELTLNVSSLGDKRLKSISENYETLKANARSRFELTKKSRPELIGNFEDISWRYRGQTIWFNSQSKETKRETDRANWPEEIVELTKAFVVNNLYKTRVRKEPLSAARVLAYRKITPYLMDLGIESLDDINSESYEEACCHIISISKSPRGPINDLNYFIEFLGDAHVLKSFIDLRSPIKDPRVKEKNGTEAKPQRMPLPELIRALISLKWAVEEQFDGSDRMISDLLCIYTQSFAYALGLRAGEILRIPEDCLFWDGPDLRCRVWTEKGHQARAPYVPSVWRELLIQTVDRIKDLTETYRTRARELEEKHTLEEVSTRIKAWQSAREQDAKNLEEELNQFLIAKRQEAKKSWELKRTVEPDDLYPMSELQHILPISPSHNQGVGNIAQTYVDWGFEFTTKPLFEGGRRQSYFATGQQIIDFTNEHIERRANFITEKEFMSILHGREVHRQNSGDKSISVLTSPALGKAASCYTFSPDTYTGQGRAPAIMSKEAALNKLRDYALGGYDLYDRIDVFSFNALFPEIPFINQAKASKDGSSSSVQNRNPLLKLSDKQKIYVKVTTEDSHVRYTVSTGYLIDINSINSMLFETYVNDNLAIEKEIWEQDNADRKEEAKFTGTEVAISSRSFSVSQRVSEFLFLRCRTMSRSSNSLVPQILSYDALHFAMQGNDRVESMFERYEVDVSEKVRKSWASHQGRHWKTTSMLRAGLEAEIVNRYMGREASQLASYDHNTGTERAKIIGEAMQDEQTRYLGSIPNTVRRMQAEQVPEEQIDEYLNDSMQSVQHTPCGLCVGSLHLNPCNFNMSCLVGNEGNGCSRYIFDTKDAAMRATLANEKDKSEKELLRLLDVFDAGNSAAEVHILRHAKIVENTTKVLDAADRFLAAPTKNTTEIAPFEDDGSLPDDCPIGCGD